jgi:NAD+ kinase
MAMVRTIGLCLKSGSTDATSALRSMLGLLGSARLLIEQEGPHARDELPEGIERVHRSQFEMESELVLAIGGDGTIIHAASLLQNRVVPVLGVNLGRIGFLAEMTRDEVADVLPAALAGALPYTDRLRLDARIVRDDKVLLRARILNDAVVAQLALARVAVYRVFRERELVTVLRGDGVIISTPTGSTAYSMAAGGSILEPSLDAIAITPICPHALSQRPLVLSPDRATSVQLQSDNAVFATLDGQVGHEFRRGDVLVVERSPVPVRLLQVPGRSHFEVLRKKLRWGEA